MTRGDLDRLAPGDVVGLKNRMSYHGLHAVLGVEYCVTRTENSGNGKLFGIFPCSSVECRKMNVCSALWCILADWDVVRWHTDVFTPEELAIAKSLPSHEELKDFLRIKT